MYQKLKGKKVKPRVAYQPFTFERYNAQTQDSDDFSFIDENPDNKLMRDDTIFISKPMRLNKKMRNKMTGKSMGNKKLDDSGDSGGDDDGSDLSDRSEDITP